MDVQKYSLILFTTVSSSFFFVCVCLNISNTYMYVSCSTYLKNHISQHDDQHPGNCPFTTVYFQFFSEMIVKSVRFSGDAHNLHLALCFH